MAGRPEIAATGTSRADEQQGQGMAVSPAMRARPATTTSSAMRTSALGTSGVLTPC